eukprot:jgi/Mesvir1/17592/Mv08824-RA.1
MAQAFVLPCRVLGGQACPLQMGLAKQNACARRGSPAAASKAAPVTASKRDADSGKAGGQSDGKEKPLRRLILLRHAKSSWSEPGLRDHDRPLSKRGEEAAPLVASKLKELGWVPELILSSDSLRTRQTLDLMAAGVEEFARAEKHYLGSFYTIAAVDGCTSKHLHEKVVEYANDSIACVMCTGHNRGWEEAASDFSQQTVELKTANAALLECHASSWKEAFERGEPWELKGIVRPGNGADD